MGQLNALKVAWENEFTETIYFSEDEVEKWLVRYINRNDEVDDTLHQLEIDMREFENQLFEIKTKHEIIMALLNEYINKWLKKTLIIITKPENQEALTTVIPPQPQQTPIKESIGRN